METGASEALFKLKMSKDSKKAGKEEQDLKKALKEEQDPKKQAAEYKDSLQRLQAEFENYKKRSDKENAVFRLHTHAEMIKSLLPVLDSFELALKNTSDKEEFTKGVEMIYAQFHSMLEEHGLCKIEAEGKQFDPYKHEVLMQVESKEDGKILEELQKGYMLNDLVLRHTKVKVGKVKHEHK